MNFVENFKINSKLANHSNYVDFKFDRILLNGSIFIFLSFKLDLIVLINNLKVLLFKLIIMSTRLKMPKIGFNPQIGCFYALKQFLLA